MLKKCCSINITVLQYVIAAPLTRDKLLIFNRYGIMFMFVRLDIIILFMTVVVISI